MLAQDPPAGTKLLQGRTVTLTVAAGSATPGKVPDVRGLDVGAARDQLEAAGYTVTVGEKAGGGSPGTVTAQSPAPGSSLAPGGAVTLTVVAGSSTTTTTVPPLPTTTTTTGAPPSTVPVPETWDR